MSDAAELHVQVLLAQDRAYACRILEQQLSTYEVSSRSISAPVRELHTASVWAGGAAELSRYWLGTIEHRLLLLQREIGEVRSALRAAALGHDQDARRFVEARDAAELAEEAGRAEEGLVGS